MCGDQFRFSVFPCVLYDNWDVHADADFISLQVVVILVLQNAAALAL